MENKEIVSFFFASAGDHFSFLDNIGRLHQHRRRRSTQPQTTTGATDDEAAGHRGKQKATSFINAGLARLRLGSTNSVRTKQTS